MYNNKRFALSIFWVVLGTILFVLSLYEKLDSVYSGFGGGLIGVGIMQIVKNIRYRTDPEYKEKTDTENHDERNRFLSMKAWSWTGYICVIGMGMAVIVLTVIGQTLYSQIAAFYVCIMLLVYLVVYMILKRKY